MDRYEVERFLFREARLMDEHRYEDWLSLWETDTTYWVPCGGEGINPETEVAIIYDRRAKLEDRIARFMSGEVLAQETLRPMRRVISNIEIMETTDQGTTVLSNFVLVQARDHDQVTWAGQTTHRLRLRDGEIRMAFKKVVLVNNGIEMPVLQFLV